MTCSWNKSRSGSRAALAVAALLLAAPATPARGAPPQVIKMATLAPEGSSWHRVFQEMGEAWKKATGGAVTLRIYPGGVAGDEGAMLRKIRVGQLQAAAITGMGLANLDRSFYALHIPMMFATDEEFDYVREKVAPRLERILAERGLVILAWGDAGWVHFFAKKPFTRPAEVKTMRLYVGAGDPNLTRLYKETGFQPVLLTPVDILQALQTGLIDAFDTTPLVALAFQWFALAPHMADFRWAPLTGAVVVERRAWEKISADNRARIMEASRETGRRLRGEVRRLNDQAVKAMVKNGLKIGNIPPDAQEEWRKMVEDIHPRIRGSIIPAEMFDLVLRYRNEYRSTRTKGKAGGR